MIDKKNYKNAAEELTDRAKKYMATPFLLGEEHFNIENR